MQETALDVLERARRAQEDHDKRIDVQLRLRERSPMFIAVLINTFHGQFEPYGMFESEEAAWEWTKSEQGKAKRRGGASYSVMEVNRIIT
jgi:hypothetical protein